ncbi:Peptidyl-prolyl cis-trans isomerase (rotamase)-cyclophilin family [Apibacter mensalis]|uniref:peptidylprolyl isomerase n=2 Tax=Apibacter mensalis TaxID=1586267 RepID=A0A0X3ANQ0_9FLAO|nr:Peptidyl-prolyl cis-trans isomerase (rotamase)-cyclophilin family [Apibacter mensalis]
MNYELPLISTSEFKIIFNLVNLSFLNDSIIMICKILIYCLLILTFINCKTLEIDKQMYNGLRNGLYANIKTSKGNMLVKFFDQESPVTVANFIGLAEGTIPNDAKKPGEPFYDGIIFHRVIKDFMIQTGDPQGTGMGGPGYRFEDEKNDLKHIGTGILSMANSGPNTNGSQFFITEVPTPWLDGKHTIFGEVIKGLETVNIIARVKTGAQDKPIDPVIIEKVSIITKGDEYKNYDAAQFFKDNKDLISNRNKKYLEEKQKVINAKLDELKLNMIQTSSGLFYKIDEKGSGAKAKSGDTVSVHYEGSLVNGNVFDSSFARNEPIEFPLGRGMVIKGWEEGISLLNEGDKATFLIPPSLGYGAQGAGGGVIPPNAWLIFKVELVKAK